MNDSIVRQHQGAPASSGAHQIGWVAVRPRFHSVKNAMLELSRYRYYVLSVHVSYNSSEFIEFLSQFWFVRRLVDRD